MTPQIQHEDLIGLIRENIQDLIAVIDSNRRRVWFNDAYSATLGFTRAELETADSTSTLHPDDLEGVRASFEAAMNEGKGSALRYRMRHKSGSWVWLESRSRVIESIPGIGKCLILVARDITRQMELQLRQEAEDRRLKAQKECFTTLTRAPELLQDDAGLLAGKVAAEMCRTLSGREVSLWWLEGGSLVRQGVHRTGASWESAPLRVEPARSRLEAWEQATLLAFENGGGDELTGGRASLQVVLRRGGMVAGILVIVDAETRRIWHADEESFAESMGAVLVQNLEARERRLAFVALEASQKKLAEELAEAADYVQALLPRPSLQSPVTDWIFVPSAELGGDAFGYHWIDGDHFAIYLLDVCGHGVGAALLSISALNTLRSGTISGVDFRLPGQVLDGMNRAFDMEKQNNMYFTLWYGVWNRREQTLTCSSGGHPPALLYPPGGGAAPALKLGKAGLVVGAMSDAVYTSETFSAPMGSTLLLFSDGVYEITGTDGGMCSLEDLDRSARQKILRPGTSLQTMVDEARGLHGRTVLEDDYSLVRTVF